MVSIFRLVLLSLFLFSITVNATQQNLITLKNTNNIPEETQSRYSSQRTLRSVNGLVKNEISHVREANHNSRYIIEIHEQPVFSKKIELTKVLNAKNKKNKSYSGNTLSKNQKSELNFEVKDYLDRLAFKQQTLVASWTQKKLVNQVIRRNTRLHNSIVVDVTDKQLSQLRTSPEIKKIHKVTRVSKYLEQSVGKINAPQVWTQIDDEGKTITGQGIKVAIIDTGIDYTHPDLGGCLGAGCKVAQGYDFIDDDDDPMDVDGHGTHVAGIVAASGPTLKGVAPDAILMAVKVLNDQGVGFSDTIIAGIEFAVDPDGDPATDDGAHVINMSLGGPGGPNDPISVAVNNAVDAGVIVVVAAGNDGNFGDIGRFSPSSAEKAITVGSTNKSDELSIFSSKGPSLISGQLKPEIVAPGSDIKSLAPNGAYISLDGTSMASPHVAGAAALIVQAKLGISPIRAKTLLISGAVNLDLEPFEQGFGRLDINASINNELLIVSSDLILGRIDDGQQSYSFNREIVLENTSDIDVQLTVGIPTTFPEQVTFTVQEIVNIAANSQITVAVAIDITDVINIPFPESTSGAFADNIRFVSDKYNINIPVVIERNHKFTLTHNSPKGIDVSIDDEKGNNYYWNFINNGETKEFFMPSGNLFIVVKYPDLGSSDVPNIVFPTINPRNKLSITGYESFKVEVNGDKTFALDINNLRNVVGVDQVTSSQGNDDLSSHVTVGTQLITDIQVADLDISYGSENSFNSDLEIGRVSFYLVTGSLSSNIESTFIGNEKLASGVQRERDSYFHTFKILNDTGELYLLNEQQADMVSFTGVDYLMPDGYDFSLSFDNYGFSPLSINASSPIINYARVGSDLGNVGSQFAIITQDDDFVVQILAQSNILLFDEKALIDTENKNATLVLAGEQIKLSAQGLMFSSVFDSYGGALSEFGGEIPFTSIDGVQVFSGVDASYLLSCDGKEISSGKYDFYNHVEGVTNDCNDISLNFEFDSYLNGQRFTSFARHENANVVNGMHIFLTNEGKRIYDQNVSGDKTKLTVTQSNPSYPIDLEKIEIKVGAKQQWSDLSFSLLDDAINTYSKSYEMNLPVVENLSEAASIRVTYNTEGTRSVQTLNGLFNIGIDYPAEGDFDGDGIVNSEDSDNDNDGVLDEDDAFPLDAAESVDTDNDGIGNIADGDDDGDGVSDNSDVFPLDASESFDTDNDGVGNNADTDDDDDWVLDSEDAYPLDPTRSIRFVSKDQDGDGKADILWRSSVSGTNALWTMNSLSITNNTGINRVFDQVWQIAGRGDFNGDRKSDLLWRNYRTGQNVIYLMDGANILNNQSINFVNDLGWEIKGVADFNADGKDDILWRHVKRGDTAIYLMNGNQIILGQSNLKVADLNWKIITTADVNGDGKSDVVWRNTILGTNYVWLMNGMKITNRYTLNTVGNSWKIVGAGDLNADGTDDLIWRHLKDGRNVVYFMNQNGQIEDTQQINIVDDLNWQIADILDLNGDGKDDLFWRNAANGLSYIYLMSGAEIQKRGYSNPIGAAWQNIR
jgi:minor extracellular serine protease Vpr